MRETEKRIKRYEARLPRVREKIFASLALFGVAFSMLAVATFSWITLSIAPEVGNITTTIAANGSLEIALADSADVLPGESKVGDGDSRNSLTSTNLTWGNLINLSDPAYGLDKITLRPASLNTSNLKDEPLFAADYTADGRVIKLRSDFRYTVYDPETKTFDQADDPNKRGIRAISYAEKAKVDWTDNKLMEVYLDHLDNANGLIQEARWAFNEIGDKDNTIMDPVIGLMGTYTNTVLSKDGNPEKVIDAATGELEPWTCSNEDVEGFYDLLAYVNDTVMTPLGQAMMHLMKIYQLQTDSLTDSSGTAVNYTPTDFGDDLDAFCADAVAELATINAVRASVGKDPIAFSALKTYCTDRVTLQQDILYMENVKGYATIYWSDIDNEVVFHLVKIDSVTLKGKTMSQWFASISQNLSGLTGILSGSYSDNLAIVHDGMLERLDKILHNGAKECFHAEEVTLKFSNAALKKRAGNYGGLLGNTNSIKASVKTDAVTELPTSCITTDIAEVKTVISAPTELVKFIGKETYGLAIDFWLRTNHSDSFLVLEGDVETEGIPVKESVEYTPEGATTATSADNIQIYVGTIVYKTTYDYDSKEDEFFESSLENQDVFSIDGVWYLKSNGQPIDIGTSTSDIMDGETKIGTETLDISFAEDPTEKMHYNVIGYSGANRVWKEDQLNEQVGMNQYDKTSSTTQGSGSCYTFYADPVDMDQSLEMLSALRVAFVDNATGSLLASGYFDVEKYYAEYGAVTVPLYLDSSASTIETPDGKIPVITALPKNTPILVTAIVYLEGTNLMNHQVFSSSEIDGTLNIQFGSYTSPSAMNNEDLAVQVRTIVAELAEDYRFTGKEDEERDVTVNLTITGTTPKTVTGYFIRKISETHGTRHEAFTFTSTGDGTWSGTVSIDSPGEFILRTVKVDGIEYRLNQNELPTVTVPGITVKSVSGEKDNTYVYRTADNYVTEKFDIVVGSGPNGWPRSVKSVFKGDSGATITTSYTGSGDKWTADITFTSSDTYTMTHVIIDDEYFEITPIVREVYTGLYAEVKLQIPSDDTYVKEEDLKITAKGFSYYFMGQPHEFVISVKIFDNAGNPLKALGNVKLNYSGDLNADLEWDESKGCYGGEEFMINKPGSYVFDYITVSGEVINRTTDATTITAVPKDPVAYLSIGEIDDYVVELKEDTATEITLKFENALAASVYGLFAKNMSADTVVTDLTTQSEDTTYLVMLAKNDNAGSSNPIGTHTFHIPAEDGYYTLIDVKVANVFDKSTETFFSGNDANETWPKAYNTPAPIESVEDQWFGLDEFTDSNGEQQDCYYDIGDLGFVDDVKTTKVVKTITVSKPANITFDGNFMISHTISGLTATFADFEGEALKEEGAISGVKLKFTYNANPQNFGGYSSTSLNSEAGSFEVELTPDDEKRVFTQSADSTVTYAGTYNSKLYYYVGESTTELEADGPIITVNSTAPSVIISAVNTDTNTEIPTKIIWTQKTMGLFFKGQGLEYTLSEEKTNLLDATKNEVTVYAKATTENEGVNVSSGDAGFVHPKLKFKAVGVDESTKVTFVIPKGNADKEITVSLTGTTESSEYTLGSNTGKIKEIADGYLGVTYTVWGYNGHGDQTIKTVTVTTGDGIVCTVTLDKPIVIHNPSSVNKTS